MNHREPCSICGAEAIEVTELREFQLAGRSETVPDRFLRCSDCGEEYYLPGWLDRTMSRVSTAIREREGLLQPEQIRQIREMYGLSQRDFEKILGVGPKTVVRWERGTVFQSKAADSLLRLIGADPRNAEHLARLRGVELAAQPAILESWHETPRAALTEFFSVSPSFSEKLWPESVLSVFRAKTSDFAWSKPPRTSYFKSLACSRIGVCHQINVTRRDVRLHDLDEPTRVH